MNDFNNVITALITPFYQGAVDETSFIKLLYQQLEAGVTGFVVNGTTGESPTLSETEVKRLFDIAKVEAGVAATLIVGTGSNSTAEAIEKTRKAKNWGAKAALLVVPYYNRPPQRGLIAHFTQIAKAVDLPQILYNVPSRTSCSLEMASVAILADQPRIVGIKEATGDLGLLRELKKIKQDSFCLLSGDDGSGVEFCHNGGHGIISVVSHLIPKHLVNLIARARKGDASANEEYGKYKELLRWLYIEANPIPVKWALKEMGIIRSAELRLPLIELAAEHHEGFSKCLKALDLK
jgi:4-hydroxy-tetrahydrodipicolinate synthase